LLNIRDRVIDSVSELRRHALGPRVFDDLLTSFCQRLPVGFRLISELWKLVTQAWQNDEDGEDDSGDNQHVRQRNRQHFRNHGRATADLPRAAQKLHEG